MAKLLCHDKVLASTIKCETKFTSNGSLKITNVYIVLQIVSDLSRSDAPVLTHQLTFDIVAVHSK